MRFPLRLFRPRALRPAVVVPLALVQLAAFASAGPVPALASSGVAARLQGLQRGLELVTLPIRVQTATWMALVGSVHGRQADLRQATAAMRLAPKHARGTAAALQQVRARIRADHRVLDRLLPGWLRIKVALHAEYVRVKGLLRESRRMVKAMLGARPGAGSPSRWLAAWPVAVHASDTLQVCPVAGPVSLTDTFGAPRPGGRFHEGNDLLAARGTPELAVQPGVVVPDPNTLGGNAIMLRSASGYSYYAHLSSYGATGSVQAGDVIGYVGASGDAKGLIPHLHYEWHPGGGPAVDPFPFLEQVCP